MQKAWKELNERVNQNELVHQQQIIEMLSRQKESCLQRMLRLEKGGFCFLLGITLLILMDFIYLKGQLVFWQATFGILLYVLTLNFIGIIKLEKIKTERNLEEQIKNVLQYKKLFHWGYITGYPIVTIFLGVFFYNYHQWWMVLTISILMLMAILTDYFLFHYVSDRIKELTRVNKELAELKEEHKE